MIRLVGMTRLLPRVAAGVVTFAALLPATAQADTRPTTTAAAPTTSAVPAGSPSSGHPTVAVLRATDAQVRAQLSDVNSRSADARAALQVAADHAATAQAAVGVAEADERAAADVAHGLEV